MLGVFRATTIAFGGLARWNRLPREMNRTRKANVRKRLKAVDAVVQAVVDSGVKVKVLV